MEHPTFCSTTQIDRLTIFYREAGPKGAPTLLLLPGFPLHRGWNTQRAFWADRAANESALRANLLSLPTTRTRHVGNDPNEERYDPDLVQTGCVEKIFQNSSPKAHLVMNPTLNSRNLTSTRNS